MNYDYDEAIVDNVFYQTLTQEYCELFSKCVTEGCILCVPRVGSVSKYMLTFEDFCAHILVPSCELPESHFFNINGEEVRICNRIITIEHEVGHQSTIHILFEETFYREDDLKYKVLCIEKPIESKNIQTEFTSKVNVLRTLRECTDFLWMQCGSSEILEKINQLTDDFLKTNSNFGNCNLQDIVDLVKALYSKCMQYVLKCQKIRQHIESEKNLMQSVKVAVETYMLHNIYNKVMQEISTITAIEDANLNKILRNLSSLEVQDLEIRPELYDAIPKAKSELSKIESFSTVLGKGGCLKKMFLALSNHSNNTEVVTADDVLQILIFLIVKIGLPNWNAQLRYLKLFRFSTQPQVHDEVCFLVTSLEAAVEHIQSEILPDGSNSVIKCRSITEESSKAMQNKLVECKLDGFHTLYNFFKAVSMGNLEEVKIYVNSEKSKENELDHQLCHPLCLCARCSALTSRDREKRISVNASDGQGLTALHVASMYCKSTMVEFLLANGADPNISDLNGLSAMHYAAMKGHQNGLLLMAYAGADVNVVDCSLNTPLHYCSNNGHENCVKALIYFCENSGIKLNVNAQNSDGDIALHKASRWGYLNILKILLENGADPTIRNKRKLSSIDVAHNSKALDILTQPCGKIQNYVRVIPFRPMLDQEEEQANHNTISKQTVKGIVPHSLDQLRRLEKTLKAIRDGDNHLTCFYLGLDTGELENIKDAVYDVKDLSASDEKCHPLCRCSKCENSSSDENQEEPELTGTKVDRMNINSCDSEGYTPLHIASIYGRIEVCKVLIRNGAMLNVQTRNELLTPLMVACQCQRLETVKILLKAGCNIDMQDREGNTALHHACRTRDAKVVNALVEYDPDFSIKNNFNKTACQEAKENMFIGVLKAIKGENSDFELWDGPNSEYGEDIFQ